MVETKKQGTLIDINSLEDSEGALGITFDPDVEYTFTVTSVETRKVKKTDESGHEGKEFTVIETQNTEEESDVNIRASFFYNKKVTINEADKAKEADAVKYARGLGYPVGVKMPFKWKEIFRPGVRFTAHVRPQMKKDGKTPTGYSEIDLMTVKGIKGAKQAKQASISGNADEIATVTGMALTVPNKTALITALSKNGMANLIQLAISLDDDKKLKYGQ